MRRRIPHSQSYPAAGCRHASRLSGRRARALSDGGTARGCRAWRVVLDGSPGPMPRCRIRSVRARPVTTTTLRGLQQCRPATAGDVSNCRREPGSVTTWALRQDSSSHVRADSIIIGAHGWGCEQSGGPAVPQRSHRGVLESEIERPRPDEECRHRHDGVIRRPSVLRVREAYRIVFGAFCPSGISVVYC